jgi:hypothetical protein
MCILFHTVPHCSSLRYAIPHFHAVPCSSKNTIPHSFNQALPHFPMLFHNFQRCSTLFHTDPIYSTLFHAIPHCYEHLHTIKHCSLLYFYPFFPLFRILVGYEYLANKAKVNYKHDNAYTVTVYNILKKQKSFPMVFGS